MKLISYFHDIIGDKLLLNFSVRFQRLYELQKSPYFCVFKYVRAVKQKFWRFFLLSPHTGHVRLATLALVRLLRHALPISLLILRKKPTVLQASVYTTT